MKEHPNLVVTEDDLVHACKVLDALGEAFDRVAAQPDLGPQLALELAQKSPEILDALLAITQPDCRPVLYDLGKKAMNVVKLCLQKKPKAKTL